MRLTSMRLSCIIYLHFVMTWMNKLKVTCVSRKVEKGENERGTRREVGPRETPAFAKGVITDVRTLSRCTLVYTYGNAQANVKVATFHRFCRRLELLYFRSPFGNGNDTYISLYETIGYLVIRH